MVRVMERARVSEDAETLWADIGSFAGIADWHPMLAEVESDGESEGALRTAKAMDGSEQTERLLETAPGERYYRYRMERTPMPVRDYTAELRVADGPGGNCTVIWSAEFEPLSDREETIGAIRSFLRAGLDNLERLHGRAGS